MTGSPQKRAHSARPADGHRPADYVVAADGCPLGLSEQLDSPGDPDPVSDRSRRSCMRFTPATSKVGFDAGAPIEGPRLACLSASPDGRRGEPTELNDPAD